MPSPKPLDREVMLQSFRQTYATVGRRPNRDEVTKYCIAKYGTYYKHFGGIDAVCDAAGLPDYQNWRCRSGVSGWRLGTRPTLLISLIID